MLRSWNCIRPNLIKKKWIRICNPALKGWDDPIMGQPPRGHRLQQYLILHFNDSIIMFMANESILCVGIICRTTLMSNLYDIANLYMQKSCNILNPSFNLSNA